MFNVLSFLFAGFAWGGSFVAIQIALKAYPCMLAAGLRLAVACVCFIIAFRNLALFKVSLRDFTRITIAGFFALALPFCLLFWGEQNISAGLGGILNGTAPVWTFVISALFFAGKKEITLNKVLGLAIGLVGILFVFGPRISFQSTSAELWGTFAVLGMSISYGVGSNLSKRLFSAPNPVNFQSNLFYQHLMSSVFILLLSVVGEKWPAWDHLRSSPSANWAILYLGVISSALAFFFFYRLLKEWGAVKASSIAYVVPVAAIFWDFMIFSNVPRITDLIGAGVILAGVGLIQSSK